MVSIQLQWRTLFVIPDIVLNKNPMHFLSHKTKKLSQQIRILHKTNKNIFFSELLAFWKVCSFSIYVLNTW